MFLKIHVQVWLAAATLHEAGKAPFAAQDLRREVKRLFGTERPGVLVYISSHANGSARKANATVYNYIVKLPDGRYRLSVLSDRVHDSRLNCPRWPDQADVEERFWPLWRMWSAWQATGPVGEEVAASVVAPRAERDEDTAHFRQSSYREAMLEHLLVGEMMRRLWPKTLEVCKPQVDAAGYDLILQSSGVLRHVQLKTSLSGGAASAVNVHVALANRSGGCVIWTRFDGTTFAPDEFLWLGGEPGQALPDVDHFPLARHTKANSEGYKAERPSHRRVPQSAFVRLSTMDQLLVRLFGEGGAPAGFGKADSVARLTAFIPTVEGFELTASPAVNYNHMGATLTEAILQAGIDYRNVVLPRVNKLRQRHPEASTTSAFLELLTRVGAYALLDFGGEKPRRVLELTRFFQQEQVETESDLRAWLANDGNRDRLQELSGVGPKTVDYMQILVGVDNSAVDRHLTAFLELAGVRAVTYEQRKRIIEAAADAMGVDRAVLDHSIWLYMSNRSRGRVSRGQ